jgi:hypothetical protein
MLCFDPELIIGRYSIDQTLNYDRYGAGMSSILSEKRQINQWLAEEAMERIAYKESTDPIAREQHFIRAEHYADYAWSLAERNDHAFIPSEIWHSSSDKLVKMVA